LSFTWAQMRRVAFFSLAVWSTDMPQWQRDLAQIARDLRIVTWLITIQVCSLAVFALLIGMGVR
jgi:hypothetical protein